MTNLKSGIVGLPNVGKSTIFNVLSGSINAVSANYAFCTIEPNYIELSVFDERLEKAAKIAESKKIIYANIGLYDIAGLVKGASENQGLGNKFLSHIREVNVIMHVVRCFENKDISHVNDKVDPLDDIETIKTELMLADIQMLTKKLEKKAKNKPELELELSVAQRTLDHLNKFEDLSEINFESDDQNIIYKNFNLLSAKPVLYLCNVGEDKSAEDNEHYNAVKSKFKDQNIALISAKIESDIIEMSDSKDERESFRQDYGLSQSVLNEIISKIYSLLGVQSYFTVGPKEARAWTIEKSSNAQKAAGKIHSDFERGFIKADVISYNDYIENNGESKCRELGLLRQEGKQYIVNDGDIIHFKFNV